MTIMRLIDMEPEQKESFEKWLLTSEYSFSDLFENGQDCYQVNIDDYKFVVDPTAKDCLLLFCINAEGYESTRIAECDLDGVSPYIAFRREGYDFLLSLTCDMKPNEDGIAYIYATVSDIPTVV